MNLLMAVGGREGAKGDEVCSRWRFHTNSLLNFGFCQILHLLLHKLFPQFQISSNFIFAFTKTLSSILDFIKFYICFHKNSFFNFRFHQILDLLSQKLFPRFFISLKYRFPFTKTFPQF